jgi:hypothetical protein
MNTKKLTAVLWKLPNKIYQRTIYRPSQESVNFAFEKKLSSARTTMRGDIKIMTEAKI